MIAVDGGKHLAALTGFPLEPVTPSPYFIDRTEVTNAAFKEFVDAGGYVSRELGSRPSGRAIGSSIGSRPWPCSSTPRGGLALRDGAWPLCPGTRRLPGRRRRAGSRRQPTPPSVERSCPRCHWIARRCPTGEHTLSMAPEIVPMSNFGGTGPAPVGSFPGIGVSGAVDLAGNLREWCWNESRGGRVALGGAWSDPGLRVHIPCAAKRFRSLLVNGFRLMLERDERSGDALRSPVTPPGIDVYTVKAISDEDFARNKGYFAQFDTPLNPVMEPAGGPRPTGGGKASRLTRPTGRNASPHISTCRRLATRRIAPSSIFQGATPPSSRPSKTPTGSASDYIPRSRAWPHGRSLPACMNARIGLSPCRTGCPRSGTGLCSGFGKRWTTSHPR